MDNFIIAENDCSRFFSFAIAPRQSLVVACDDDGSEVSLLGEALVVACDDDGSEVSLLGEALVVACDDDGSEVSLLGEALVVACDDDGSEVSLLGEALVVACDDDGSESCGRRVYHLPISSGRMPYLNNLVALSMASIKNASSRSILLITNSSSPTYKNLHHTILSEVELDKNMHAVSSKHSYQSSELSKQKFFSPMA